ncbi:hypothetical protein ER308_09670 [Egibacter rhizosphaerae]|uniref:Exo-alpha-sialidase n=1 Tax=Egibacter rhizosphaerae TaxID=1670831 RepID=A0A411YF25_9ACTN|nr:hypothetical protein [Egibacter rhizosphaerae]QBI19796.1 hypothetical protein ER308_09670 [Egibacter rhizosphaerae]
MVTLAVGTEKGGYLVDGAPDRGWELAGPLFPGWKVTAWTSHDGQTIAALASNWFGASIHRAPRSRHADPEAWQQAPGVPTYEQDAEGAPRLQEIWTLTHWGDSIVAGVEDAGLFTSEDGGVTWQGVESFNMLPDRANWFPGLGGLAAHRVLVADGRAWVGVSAVGVFRSDDDGATFRRVDEGVAPVIPESEEEGTPAGWCVHGLAHDPRDPARIWRQDHSGVYRTADGGDTWERIERGLPAAFGFPMWRDDASGRLFVVPLEADENRVPVDGRFGAWCSDDDGDSWRPAGTGWPGHPTYTAVLRGALTGDGDGGVFCGTTSGAVWASDDAGERWSPVPVTLPRVLSVAVV